MTLLPNHIALEMTAPRYRLVIFDFDGTLADSFGWFLDVFDAVADRIPLSSASNATG